MNFIVRLACTPRLQAKQPQRQDNKTKRDVDRKPKISAGASAIIATGILIPML
ncbi:hypothetical protein GPL17_33555 [Bradyrhizobium yuanmingense]|uniref:hypothetical protein n=1 Tax=Bradyrhizobium yuanmingense TaxID=108015 RepID=UPI0012F90F60|nr:hypothetical protein [Bradyrhizobium yuanmingense]MVT55361.1 hypothetical protein [Bradyrhizobium yuanmingense]